MTSLPVLNLVPTAPPEIFTTLPFKAVKSFPIDPPEMFTVLPPVASNKLPSDPPNKLITLSSLARAESQMTTHAYPLLIKQILATALASAPGQEIVHADTMRYDYRGFADRIGRAAGALRALGAGEGSVVAVLDWDSHRYLECFFAVPMIGATLHTVNVRLSPEQILERFNQLERVLDTRERGRHASLDAVLRWSWDLLDPAEQAGLTQLCRVAALELAPHGVRCNIIHPDAVFDTKLWTPEALKRSAERYGITQGHAAKIIIPTVLVVVAVSAAILRYGLPLVA